MAYATSYSADPRLKRPASNPPDAPRDPKRPATLGIRESSPAFASNGPVPRPNEVVSTTEAVADMARKSRNATIVDLKIQINLLTVATTNLQLKHDHAEFQLKSAEADYERTRNHFASFPAMKETKTAAIEKAKKAANVAREPLQSARLELRRLIESLVELEQSIKLPTQDLIIRAEFDEVKSDLTNIKNDIGSFKNDLSNAREMIDGLQASHKANQDTTTKALEDIRRNIDSQATRIDDLTTRAQVDTGLLDRLSNVESDVKDMESEIADFHKTVAKYVQGELQVPKNALVEVKAGLQKTENAVAALQTAFERTEEDTGNIREALEQGVDVQHTNAQTLQDCLDRLAQMESLLEQAADKHALANVQDSLRTLSDLVEPINAARQRTTNGTQPNATKGVTSGLASFQPVLGGDDENDVSPFHSRPVVPNMPRAFNNDDFTQMKAEIEALKYNVQDQTNRYNNLLTDQLAQNILDNLGAVYPNLKEAERVVKSVIELQGRLSRAESKLNEIGGRTGAVANRVDALDRATAAQNSSAQEVQYLRNDLTSLSTRVDQHDKDIEAGRAQLEEHANAIRGTEAWIIDQE